MLRLAAFRGQGAKAHMRRWNLSHYAISSCVTAALLAGCGGSQPPMGGPGAMPVGRTIATHAGRAASFSASYTGTFEQGCGFGCVYQFHGAGSGTFIDRSTLKGKLDCGNPSENGQFTLRSKNHLADRLYASAAPCGGSRVSYTVTGGTGIFANASGGGTVSFSLHFNKNNNTFKSSWTGTPNF